MGTRSGVKAYVKAWKELLASRASCSDAQAGAVDEADFRALYDATSPPLRAYLLHVCRRPDVADDLLQETYCRYLMRRRPVMDESQTRSWLFRIATNLIHDRGRSRIDAICPGDSRAWRRAQPRSPP